MVALFQVLSDEMYVCKLPKLLDQSLLDLVIFAGMGYLENWSSQRMCWLEWLLLHLIMDAAD